MKRKSKHSSSAQAWARTTILLMSETMLAVRDVCDQSDDAPTISELIEDAIRNDPRIALAAKRLRIEFGERPARGRPLSAKTMKIARAEILKEIERKKA